MSFGKFFAREDSTTRIDFDDGPLEGEFIRVRERISKAQQNRLRFGGVTGVRQDGDRNTIEVDATEMDMNRIRFWVLAWSLGNDLDKGRKPTGEQIELLLPEYADQILAAIDKHEAQLAADEPELLTDPKPASSEDSTDDGLIRVLPPSVMPSSEPQG